MLEKSFKILGLNKDYDYKSLSKAYHNKVKIIGKNRLLTESRELLKRHLDYSYSTTKIMEKIMKNHPLTRNFDIGQLSEEEIEKELNDKSEKVRFNHILKYINLEDEKKPKYLDDLKEELVAKIEDFKWSVQNCLKIHAELLKNEKSREKVLSNLSLLQTEITKWKELYNYE